MAILMEKDYWLNSQLSVARFYGGVTINGEKFIVISSNGDLIREGFRPFYKKLGRDKFIEILKAHPNVSNKAMKFYLNAELAHQKEIKQARKQESKEQSLFDDEK